MFAASRDVRQLCNQPHKLSLTRLCAYSPPPMARVMIQIWANDPVLNHEETDAPNGSIGSENYSAVVCAALELKQHYRTPTTDQLEVLRLHSLEHPCVYKQCALKLYRFTNGMASIPPWDDYLCHFALGVANVAAENPCMGKLFRVALIPVSVWERHFTKDSEVVFAAPMSSATSPQWIFALGQHIPADKKAVLLEFDEMLSKQAACLSSVDHPISAFGTAECEWTFGPFTRAMVKDIQDEFKDGSGAPILTQSGSSVPHVVLTNIRAIPPVGSLLAKQPTALLLNAAMLIGLMDTSGGDNILRDTCLRFLDESMFAIQNVGWFSDDAAAAAFFGMLLTVGAAAVSTAVWPLGLGATACFAYSIHAERRDRNICEKQMDVAITKLEAIRTTLLSEKKRTLAEEFRMNEATKLSNEAKVSIRKPFSHYRDEVGNYLQDISAGSARRLEHYVCEGFLMNCSPLCEVKKDLCLLTAFQWHKTLSPERHEIYKGFSCLCLDEHGETLPENVIRPVFFKFGEVELENKIQGAMTYAHQEYMGRRQSCMLSSTLIRNAFLGRVIDWDPEVRKWAGGSAMSEHPANMTSLMEIGDTIWTEGDLRSRYGDHDPGGDGGNPFGQRVIYDPCQVEIEQEEMEMCAQRAFAFRDMLLLLLSTTRLVSVMGAPDAGKSSFLESVYKIKTKGVGLGQNLRTDLISMFKHPDFDNECFRVWVADVPGYGDSVESRNLLVEYFSTMLRTMGPTSVMVWLHKADRDKLLLSDSLFDAVCGVITVAVVTHVDARFEEMLKSMYNNYYEELEDDGSDQELSDECIQDLRRQEFALMEEMKLEVEGNFHRMRGDQPGPQILYTTLDQTSWLFKGRRPRNRPQQRKPVDMKLDVRDVLDYFNMQSPEDIRAMLDSRALQVFEGI